MTMTSEPLTQAVEDYLKEIYDLTCDQERATTVQIAERMGVAPASVTGMLQRLAAATPPLLDYQKHRGAALTAEGRLAALEIIRHHRLLETFLHRALGIPWDEVHVEADRLEHAMSETLEERIAQALGHPLVDPHGEPIPTRELIVNAEAQTRLEDLRPEQHAVVQRVGDTSPEMLRYLGEIGLVPGAGVRVLEWFRFDGNLRLQIEGQAEPRILGPRITRHIYMQLVTTGQPD